MSCNGPNESINRTFILEPTPLTANTSIFSACTTLFSNLIESCSGDTSIKLSTDVISFIGNVDVNGWLSANTFSAITIDASAYYSGGTNLLDIISTNDTFLTGATFSKNTLVLKRNDDVNISLLINNFSGLTINGDLRVTGTTNFSGTSSFGGNIVSGGTNLNDIFKSINSLDVYTTGSTLLGSTIFFNRNNGLSAYSVNIASVNSGDTYTSGFTYDNLNNLSIKRNDGVNFNVNISQVSGLTVNGSLSATTLFGNGSNITGINFSQLATTAHTHPISDVVGLQTALNDKFSTSGGTVSGDVFILGNVSILGTATTINSSTLSVEDNIITLNSNVTGATQTPLLNSGFEVMRGSATTKTFLWNETNKRWVLDDNTIVNGNLIVSGTTNISGQTSFGGNIISGGTDLGNVFKSINTLDIYTTGATFNNLLVITNNTGGTFNTVINTLTGLTVNGNVNVTGTSNLSGQTSFGGKIVSGGTDIQNLFKSSSLLDVFVSGATFNNSLLTLSKTDNSQVNALINGFTALTVNGGGITTLNGVLTVTGATNISGNTSIGGNIVSGGTNLNNIFKPINSLDVYTTGSTLLGNTIYFNRNDSLSAYSINIASVNSGDTYTSGFTYDNLNNLSIKRNDGVNFNVNISQVSGLTVNGSLSATTLFGNGGNLTGISTQDTKITAFTYNNNNLLTITNSTGGTLSTLISQVSGLTVNGNINVTGTTNISGQTSFGGAIISGGTNLLNIFSLAGTSTTNTFTTGATFNSNLLTLTRNDNVQVNTLVNNFSALTVNGDIISNNTTRLSSIGVTGLTAIDSISTGTTNGVTWFYTIKSSTSLRAGTVVAGWIGASVVFTETTTTDIGNTDAVVISVTQSGGNIKFNVTPSSGTWSVNLNRMLI